MLKIMNFDFEKYDFATWRAVELGRFTQPGEYRPAILSSGAFLSPRLGQLLSRVPIGPLRRVDLVLVEAQCLHRGFWDGPDYDVVCRVAKEHGLELCPAEVGLALRAEYDDQPCPEILFVGMEPILDETGADFIFKVGHLPNHGRCLEESYVLGGKSPLAPWDHIVFVQAKG